MGCRILIADDDDRILETFSRSLHRAGHTTLTASNGKEAIQIYFEELPDVSILDVRMPITDGFEALQAIRAQDPEAEVILVTGHGDIDTAIAALRAGASDFISKPIRKDVLETALDRAQSRMQIRADLRQVEQSLARESELNAAMADLSRALISEQSIDEISLLILDRAKQLTDSRFGFVGYIDTQTGHFISSTMTRDIWDECKVADKTVIFDKFSGLWGWALENQMPLMTNHPADDPRSTGTPAGHIPIERFLAVPALIGDKLVGQIALANPQRDYTELDLGLVERLAFLYAVAIQRARTEEALLRYADEQSVLYAVAAAASTSLDPDELLTALLDTVLPAFQANAGWITIPGPTLDAHPRVAASHGVMEAFVQAEEASPLRQCAICRHLLSDSTEAPVPTLIAECQRIPREILEDSKVGRHVGVPLGAGNKVLGVLDILWIDTQPFTAKEEEMLTAIGQQIGIALYNAQLYQAARQVDRLRVLNELDVKLATTLDEQHVVEITLHETSAALEASTGAMLILSPEGNFPQRLFSLSGGWANTEIDDSTLPEVEAFVHRMMQTAPGVEINLDSLTALHSGTKVAEALGPNSAVFPVRNEDGLIAVLALGGRPANRPFNDEDLALAQAAASRVGQAIRNARLYRASEDKSTRLATVNSVTTAAVSSLEMDSVLRQILDRSRQAFGAVEGSILLLDQDQALRYVLSLSGNQDLRGHVIPPGQGIAGWVAKHGVSVISNDVQNDPRWYAGLDRLTGKETRSLIIAPLRHMGETTGVIEMVDKAEGDFTVDDLTLLESISSITSMALENARSFAAARERADELAMLNEIGMALTSTLDRSIIVHAALSQIQRLFLADNVTLFQYDGETGELELARTLTMDKELDFPLHIKPGECISGWVLEQREPAVIDDLELDPRYCQPIGEMMKAQAGHEKPLRAMMATPLLTPERVVGVLLVFSFDKGVYTLDDLNTLQAIGSTMTVGLENARLYEELGITLREREQTQAQLIHAEKMGALGRLTASIAHEINNPLQSIQGCLTLVEEEFEDQQRPDKIERYLGIATSEIERISAIVRRMREFYRQAGESMQPTDLQGIVDMVIALAGKQLQHSSVTVEREGDQTIPQVQANPNHLKQVFLNLVLNAIDAMPDGGTLIIRTSLSQIHPLGSSSPIPAALIEFTDTGVGMPPETLARAFEPFFTTKEDGSGLGLSISYSIVEAHSGEITATSNQGAGSTFAIRLPIEQD